MCCMLFIVFAVFDSIPINHFSINLRIKCKQKNMVKNRKLDISDNENEYIAGSEQLKSHAMQNDYYAYNARMAYFSRWSWLILLLNHFCLYFVLDYFPLLSRMRKMEIFWYTFNIKYQIHQLSHVAFVNWNKLLMFWGKVMTLNTHGKLHQTRY